MVLSLPYDRMTSLDIKHFYSAGRKAEDKERGAGEPSLLVLHRQQTNTALYTEIMGNIGRSFKDTRRTLPEAPAFRKADPSSLDKLLERINMPTTASLRMSRHMQEDPASPRCQTTARHCQGPQTLAQRKKTLTSSDLSASVQRLTAPTFITRVRNAENRSMYRTLPMHKSKASQ